MLTRLGIYSILAGFFIGVFTGISRFMKSDNFWVDLTISKFTGEYSDTIVDFIPVDFIQDSLYFAIYELPFAGAILGLGILFFMIGAIGKQH